MVTTVVATSRSINAIRMIRPRAYTDFKDDAVVWLGPKIRKRMDDLGITPAVMCKATGIKSSTLSDYLNGKSEPSLSKIAAIASVIMVDWCFFFERDFWPTD